MTAARQGRAQERPRFLVRRHASGWAVFKKYGNDPVHCLAIFHRESDDGAKAAAQGYANALRRERRETEIALKHYGLER